MKTQPTSVLRSPITAALAQAEQGVWLAHWTGRLQLIHRYDGGDYALSDIVEFFLLGEVLEEDGAPGVELDKRELARLPKLAKERRGDHPPEFIAMCCDIYRAAAKHPLMPVTLYANF